MDTSVQAANMPGQVGPKPWALPAVLASLVIPVLLWASSLAYVVAAGAPADLSDSEVITNLILTVLIVDGIFLAAPAMFCFWRYRQGWDALGLRSFDRDQWWVPFAVAGAAHAAIIAYSALLVAVGADKAVPEQEDVQELFDSRAVLPLAGVATVLMAPLAEEVFFRGFVFAGLIRPFGVAGAMVVSGSLFGMFHIQSADTVALLLPFGAIGVFFAWVYYKTGSLWLSIGAHFLFNLVSFTILATGAAS